MMEFDNIEKRLHEFANKEFGRGASEGELQAASAQLGVPLAGAYRDFLTTFGWGGVEHLELYGLGEDTPDHLHLVKITESERKEAHPALPIHLLPVMNDGFGNLYCLDTKAETLPIVLWDHERDEAQEPELQASDFAVWLIEQLDSL